MNTKSHPVTLSEPACALVEAVVASGRYRDFSAAVQDAVWQQFMGERAVFDEYGVTPAEVERSAQRDLVAIRKDRKAGKLKAWSPLGSSSVPLSSGPPNAYPAPRRMR